MIVESWKRVREDQKWLSSSDPSMNQNIASNAQYKGTAKWFFEGNTSMEWKSKPTTSLLWIHGKRAPFTFVSSQILITSNCYSGFREERPLVRYRLSSSLLKNLYHILVLQSSKTYWRCRRLGKPPWRISISILRTPINKTFTMRFLPFLHSSPLVPTVIATYSPTFIRHTRMARINPA